MSKLIFSAEAAVDVDLSLPPLLTCPPAGRSTLKPGERIIDGRVFYSAAWLDQATLGLRRDARPERESLHRGAGAASPIGPVVAG